MAFIHNNENENSGLHDQKFHENCLSKICRLCSARLLTSNQIKEKKGRTYPVQKYSGLIKTLFGIDVIEDQPNVVHPAQFCNGCRAAMTNYTRRPKSTTIDTKKQSVREVDDKWKQIGEHVSSCFTCKTFTKQSKGGVNAKNASPYRAVLSEVQPTNGFKPGGTGNGLYNSSGISMASTKQKGTKNTDNQNSEIHDQKFHEQCLSKVCRFCFQRLHPPGCFCDPPCSYPVQEYAEEIVATYSIDVTKDIPGKVHPTMFCQTCKAAIEDLKVDPWDMESAAFAININVVDIHFRWNKIGETVSDCFTCRTFTLQSNGVGTENYQLEGEHENMTIREWFKQEGPPTELHSKWCSG